MPDPAPAGSEYRASLPAIWSALIAVYLIWGSTYLAIRYAVETMPPFLMAAVRFIISGGFLYGLRRFSGDPAPKVMEWRSATTTASLKVRLCRCHLAFRAGAGGRALGQC